MRRRDVAGDQRGMTLVETILALALSVMLILPMMGWAQVAMREQVAVRERNIAGTSLGLLRSYYFKDVTTAHRAVVSGDELVDCLSKGDTEKSTGAGGTPLLTLTTNQQRIVYSIAPTEDSEAGLWRRVCAVDGGGTTSSLDLVSAVNAKLTDVICEASALQQSQQILSLFRDDELAQANQAPSDQQVTPEEQAKLDEQARADEKAKAEEQAKLDEQARADEKVKAEEQALAERSGDELSARDDRMLSSTTRIDRDTAESTPCRRVELRVSTPELRQVVLSAVVRADGTAVLDDSQVAPVVAITADPTSGPAALKVQFSSKGSSDPRGGALTFRWDFGDGNTSDESDPVHVYSTPGTFTAVLTVTNELGVSARGSVDVTALNNAPVAVIAAPANGLSTFRGQLLQFSSKGSNDDADAGRGSKIVGWAWDFGDGTTSTVADPVKGYDRLRPEGYLVTLTVTDSEGATGTTAIAVKVVNRIPTVTITANRTSGTTPLSVDLNSVVVDESTMLVNPALSYLWDFGNGATSTLADPPAVTYTGAGTRTVRLTVTDDAGATATATQVVTVSAAASVPAPTNLRMTNSGVEQGKRFAEFAWDRVETGRGYEVFMQCVNCADTATGQETGTTVRIRNLAAARHTYTAQVRSRDAAGNWGPWSATITVTP